MLLARAPTITCMLACPMMMLVATHPREATPSVMAPAMVALPAFPRSPKGAALLLWVDQQPPQPLTPTNSNTMVSAALPAWAEPCIREGDIGPEETVSVGPPHHSTTLVCHPQQDSTSPRSASLTGRI